ncbi:MAG: FtsX-like permease family protein [Acidimicrobiaceae bacterium]|nr:FtsX-like permease family protein [Acidimicrobiaceae bacterium]
MVSAPARKSITDLSRRKSRTMFAVGTLALAVAGIGIFALPTLMNRSMNATVTSDRLPDLTISTRPIVLDHRQLAALAALPNVTAVEPRSVFAGQVYVGARRASVQVRGVADFSRQASNVVHVVSGATPRDGQVLTDVQNAKHGLLHARTGQKVRIIGANGAARELPVSGEARNLDGGQAITFGSVIVLYADSATVDSLSGVDGYEYLDFRLKDTGSAAQSHTVAAIRQALTTVPGFRGFTDLPQTRAPGNWPGKSNFTQFTKFLYVITILALLSALVLISNTVTTLVAEETSEIGIMKVVGGRRRQIAAVYLKTAVLLGALGTVVGIGVGIVLANGLARYFGSTLFAITTGLGVDWRILLVSGAVGLVAPPLVALPAIRRAVRLAVRDSLHATGSAVGGQDAGDRLLRRIRFLPRATQIGLRNVGRRRRRSFSTALVIAFAVGTLLAILGFANGVTAASRSSWADEGEDVKINSVANRPLDATAERLIAATPGVAGVEPMFVTNVHLDGESARIWAIRQSTIFHYHIASGRWYTPAEEQTKARVAVVERDIARATGTRVGNAVSVDTAAGPIAFHVIGIANNQQEGGAALFVPLTTMHAVMTGWPADANDYWVRTTSQSHALIAQTTTRIEDTLLAHGYNATSEIKYVKLANAIANYRTLTTTLAGVGSLVVAISMAGLANALTTSVLERIREIGILRALGARARHIRRIFATETFALATAGWLIAIPLGYLLDRFLVWMVKEVMNLAVPFTFPMWYAAPALAGTILLALLITLAPISRAVHYRPGEALRYQ